MDISLITKSIDSVNRRGGVTTMIICALVTATVLGLWIAAISSVLYYTSVLSEGWLETLLDWILGVSAGVLAWFLFPVLIPLIASMFLDTFLKRIAMEEYQHTLTEVPLYQELPKTLWMVLQAVLINLVLLPLYFIPLFGQVLYYSVNGYLLAREFWVMVSDRLMVKQKTLANRRMTLLMPGILFAVGATIPLLNLLIPLLAGAYTLHLGMNAVRRERVKPKNNSVSVL